MTESKTTGPRIAVLIPCYNEAATVQQVVNDFRRELPDARIYVFDNNSTDETGNLARSAGAVVIREKKQGKGHVVAAMFEKISADYLVIVDGDDTYPAERVRELLAPVMAGEADMVVGRRRAADQPAAYRPFHVFGNWLVRRLINTIFGSDLRDIMSGYRVLSGEVAMNLPIIAYGFDIETEMTIQCLYRKWVIREIDVPYRARPEGSVSKLSTFRDGLVVLFRILSLFRSYKPLTFFGGMGILLFLASGVMAATVWLVDWSPGSAYRLSFIFGAGTLLAMSLIAVSIGVIVQLINFRFLELDSVFRRHRSRSSTNQSEERNTHPGGD
ncbi:MAG: glycosyltransferase family 2 protein [Phycisphaerae bacterium]